MRKNFLLIICALALITGTVLFKNNVASANAAAEIAMELSTGTVLYQSNADNRLPMASTTKIMTAIIIVEDCNLSEEIKVPDCAVGVEGSSVYLKKNEIINIEDLVYGLMLRSGNDCATALAVHHSGSVENFAAVMNERAKEWGAENTNFKNPSGLPDSEHYTTAHDLCKITCHAMKNQKFREIVSTKNYSGKFRSYANKNKMLYNFSGATGVKTGYTVAAGRCLVSSALRNGMEVVTVVLNCPDMYAESGSLLERCFNNYKLINLNANSVFMSDIVPCKLDKSLNLVLKSEQNLQFQIKTVTSGNKIKTGDFVAELQIYGGNNLILSEKLYSIIDK